ncbi:MAG: Neutral/alkaline non-lysosomal ceramidase [Verrucomicrobiales bacterium]|nr:Neutral/alkaline non-lysosomal ceramidase [Verrucomicrobiales bacterium]
MAGAATADISPFLGTEVNGNMHRHWGTNIHDALHARAVVLDDGEHKLAICVADSCMIYREIFDEAKKRVHEKSGFPIENILMSATHSHSAPASVSIFQAEADKEYQHLLAMRMADAVLMAINNLAPAKIGWVVANEPRYVSNRRWKMKPGLVNKDLLGGTNDVVRMNPLPGSPDLVEPAGATDPELPILAVKTLDDKPIAVLANYSTHYCGGVPDGTISADYFGAFADRVQKLLGADHQDPPFVAIMSNGTSGDCNTTNFREKPQKEKPFERIERVANDVADTANAAYKNIQWHDWVPLKTVQKEISIAVRKPTAEELTKAKERLAKVKLVNGQLPTWSLEVYSRETVLLNEFPNEVPLILQAHRIGDLAICAIPCEVFVEIGLGLKKNSPFKPTFTIELANGYNGYLPTPAQHKLGGYETWRARSSYLETNASGKVSEAILQLLSELK